MASIGNGRDGSEAVQANGPPSVERDAVLDQLHRMLAHPLFCNSKRYPGLLQHFVEHALAGKVDQLKERTKESTFFTVRPTTTPIWILWCASPLARSASGSRKIIFCLVVSRKSESIFVLALIYPSFTYPTVLRFPQPRSQSLLFRNRNQSPKQYL